MTSAPTPQPQPAPLAAPVPFTTAPWSEITDRLFIGCHDYDDPTTGWPKHAIVHNEFDLVMSLFNRWGHGPDDGVDHLRATIPDAELDDAHRDRIGELVDAVVDAHAAGRRVLVRCQAGINRSALVVALVLLRQGHTPGTAIALIRERRVGWALCNDYFVAYIHAAAS
jgi:hypothetical protein